MKRYRDVFLSLGTNMGNTLHIIIETVKEIDSIEDTFIKNISSFYVTEPIGYLNQPDFINFGIYIKTKKKPYELLRQIQLIEKKLHRERKIRWGSRNIDIDIVFYDNLSIKRTDLIIPHKEYKNRNFVLYPLNEIFSKKEYCKNRAKGKIKKIKLSDNIILSACLAGIDCKYNGKNNYNRVIKMMCDKLNFVPICPEQLGGMSTPRNPVEIKGNRVLTAQNEDFTEQFDKGAKESLKIAEMFKSKLAVLKSKSPSCGYGEIYDGNFNKTLIKGNGKAADMLSKSSIKIIKW